MSSMVSFINQVRWLVVIDSIKHCLLEMRGWGGVMVGGGLDVQYGIERRCDGFLFRLIV